jgi:serine/threonine protein kinase/TPR repeat protein
VKPAIQPLRDGDPKSFQGWTLKGLIGVGGQSTIYLAEKNGRQVALKVIKKENLHDQLAVDRFFTEIKNLELLDHPNIARYVESNTSSGVPYFAVEYVDGMNLEDHVKLNGPIKGDEWFRLALSLAEILSYCHSREIIHKDVSPGNIVLGNAGPILIDFGLSYLEKDPRLTSVELIVGTPPYMSPEQFGSERSPAMDIFSLAGTLIFAATGHYPFSGANSSEWRESILFDLPEFHGLSEEQVSVLSPLLYKKPEDRGSLKVFSQLVKELAHSGTKTKLFEKEFAKVKRQSQSKLIQRKKNLSIKNRRLKTIISAASFVAILSVGFVAFGILTIQNKSSINATNSQTPVAQGTKNANSEPSGDPLSAPTDQNATLVGGLQKDNSPINKEIQANLDLMKKYYDANQLDKALTYAKLAANAGNARGMYSVAFILADQGNSQEAASWYEKSANLGYGDAFWNLGALYMKLGKTESALNWYEKGAKNKNVGSINALGFYYSDKKGDYSKAITYYKRAADLGSVMGMSNLGLLYEEVNDKDNARKWYTRASDLGSVDASINLGYLYEQNADWPNARKYYKLAADKKDPLGMYNLAIVLGNQFGQGDQGCVLLKEALLIKSIESDTKKLVDAAIAKGCSDSSVTSKVTPKPIASSDSFKASAPIASNVQIDGIFGNAFKNRLMFWVIPLTNVKGAKVPELTSIQFRLVGFPDAGWLDIPYKLKVDETFGTVYAEVDDILFAVIFKEQKYCPEFRVVREENGKIVHIWTKGRPDCATDYNP